MNNVPKIEADEFNSVGRYFRTRGERYGKRRGNSQKPEAGIHNGSEVGNRLKGLMSRRIGHAFPARFLFLAAALTSRSAVPQTPGNLIHVDLSGFRNDKGQVSCSLYSSADGFPKKSEKAIAHVTSAISANHAVCEFSGVAQGRYAISAFHDENSNGKLDTNFIGMPREGVGASNDAKGHMGPPKYDAAAFQFSGGRADLKITIHYL